MPVSFRFSSVPTAQLHFIPNTPVQSGWMIRGPAHLIAKALKLHPALGILTQMICCFHHWNTCSGQTAVDLSCCVVSSNNPSLLLWWKLWNRKRKELVKTIIYNTIMWKRILDHVAFDAPTISRQGYRYSSKVHLGQNPLFHTCQILPRNFWGPPYFDDWCCWCQYCKCGDPPIPSHPFGCVRRCALPPRVPECDSRKRRHLELSLQRWQMRLAIFCHHHQHHHHKKKKKKKDSKKMETKERCEANRQEGQEVVNITVKLRTDKEEMTKSNQTLTHIVRCCCDDSTMMEGWNKS